MTRLNPIEFDARRAKSELDQFAEFLASSAEFGEAELRDFVRARTQLISGIGLLNGSIDSIDRWGAEVDLGGRHSCDLVVGDSEETAYTLIEMEAAKRDSLLEKRPTTPYFADRFKHGYSQLVDWLCFLDGTQFTPQFRSY